ncbi:phosphoribosylanthranilate isomerase [soil metagenome]
MTKVKICGITNIEDARLAVNFGADALGFNFYEKSPRYISAQDAKAIAETLQGEVLKVGVFVNMEESKIGECVDLIGLDAVQLHGDEDADFVTHLRAETDAQVIKAFRVDLNFQAASIADFRVDAVLLDAYAEDEYGGTGKTFDWKTAEAAKALTPQLYLAGGLTYENVSEAIKTVRPFAVDVASGVESSPGKKDPRLMEAFIRNAKNA